MRNENRRPAFDCGQEARIGGGRKPTRAQPRDAIASIQLYFTGIAKVGADRPCRGRDETAGRKYDDFADEPRTVGRQTPGDPIAKCVTNEMHRTATQYVDGLGYIGRQIVKRDAL
jgi:hypothetical protein